jgi:hypothetical protein
VTKDTRLFLKITGLVLGMQLAVWGCMGWDPGWVLP